MDENMQEITEQLVNKVIKLDTTLKELRQVLKQYVNNFDKSIEKCYHDISIRIIGTKPFVIREDNEDVNYYMAIAGLHLELISEEINNWRSHVQLYDLSPDLMMKLVYQFPEYMQNLLEVATTQSLTLSKALLKAKTTLGDKQNEV